MPKPKRKKPPTFDEVSDAISQLPPRPPQSLEEAVLFGALSVVSEGDVRSYVNTVYSRGKGPKKEREAGMRAILKLATVGFSFYNWYNHRDGLTPNPISS